MSHDVIFRSVKNILEFQKKLVQNFDNRIDEWYSSQQIADIFANLSDDLKVYEDFINRFETSFKTIVDYSAKSKAFLIFLTKKNDEVS